MQSCRRPGRRIHEVSSGQDVRLAQQQPLWLELLRGAPHSPVYVDGIRTPEVVNSGADHATPRRWVAVARAGCPELRSLMSASSYVEPKNRDTAPNQNREM